MLRTIGENTLKLATKFFENRTKNTKDMGGNVKNIKIAKNLQKISQTAMNVL